MKQVAKRSNFEKRPRDLYETPVEAVRCLMPHLKRAGVVRYIEPCAGSGKLVRGIEVLSAIDSIDVKCMGLYDIHPLDPSIMQLDANDLRAYHLNGANTIITNPPFSFHVLKHLIPIFTHLAPTWLLLPHDFSANLRSGPFMEHCHKIQPIGRVKWIENSKHMGMENSSWYQFRAQRADRGSAMYPRRRLKGL